MKPSLLPSTLFSLFTFFSPTDRLFAESVELEPNADMNYIAPALSSNLVYVDSPDCPARIRLAASSSATAKITVHVEDEKGNDLPGATVKFYFRKFSIDFGTDHMKPNTKIGVTDAHGYVSASGESCWDVGFRVEKEGYYSNWGKYFLRINATKESVDSLGRWQPWNPVLKSKLFRIVNPVCESHIFSVTGIPLEERLPFDVRANDFVKPYGVGVLTNLLFLFSVSENQESGFAIRSNSVSITTYGNGFNIVGKRHNSEMMYPREMPVLDGNHNYEYTFCYIDNRAVKNGNPVSGDNALAVDCLSSNGVHYSVLITRLQTNFSKKTVWLNMGYKLNPIPNSKSLETNPNFKKVRKKETWKKFQNPAPIIDGKNDI